MKMTKTYQRTKRKQEETEELPGYPEYSYAEDIYIKGKEEDEIDPENTSRKKNKSYIEDADDDLDIPGSEMDDELEEIGSEDEENNYYSLSDNDDLEDLY